MSHTSTCNVESTAFGGDCTCKHTPVADINTLGDKILKFLRIPFMNIFGINEDGTENSNDLYLRRYYIYRGKHRPHIYLHHIVRSDYERACHDHPWPFTSLILKGGYTEICETVTFWGDDPNVREFWTTKEWKGPGSVIRHKATDLHRLELRHPAWSLVFTGERERDWGFFTHDKGWIKWNTLYQYIKDMMS